MESRPCGVRLGPSNATLEVLAHDGNGNPVVLNANDTISLVVFLVDLESGSPLFIIDRQKIIDTSAGKASLTVQSKEKGPLLSYSENTFARVRVKVESKPVQATGVVDVFIKIAGPPIHEGPYQRMPLDAGVSGLDWVLGAR